MPVVEEGDTQVDLEAPDEDTLQNLVTPSTVDGGGTSSEAVSDDEDTLTDMNISGARESSLELPEPGDSDDTQFLDASELSLEGLELDMGDEAPGVAAETGTLTDIPAPDEDEMSSPESQPQAEGGFVLDLDGFDENPTMTLDRDSLLQQSDNEISLEMEPTPAPDEEISLEIEGLDLEDSPEAEVFETENTTTPAVTPDLSNESSSSIASVIEHRKKLMKKLLKSFWKKRMRSIRTLLAYFHNGRPISQMRMPSRICAALTIP